MTYLLQPKPPKTSATRNAFRAVVVIAVIALLFSFVAPGVLPQALGVVVSPLWKGRTHLVGAVGNLRLFSTRKDLIAENTALREENRTLQLNDLKFDLLSAENRELRGLLGARSSAEGVAAAVILHPSQTYYDIFVVDKVAGASVGNLAIVSPIVLGTIAEDLGTSLKVVLYSSPGTTVEGRLLTSGAPIVLEGRGGGNFTAVVPKDLPVSENDLIVLPHRTSLVIAKVASIDEAETDSFKLVRAAIPTNIFSLRWLEIVPNE